MVTSVPNSPIVSNKRILSLAFVSYLPAIVSLLLILTFSVNVPFWDEWDTYGNVYYKVLQGKLSIADLFAQQNESRLLLPRLIMLLLWQFSVWKPIHIMVVSWLLMVGTAAIILHFLRVSLPASLPASFSSKVSVVSVIGPILLTAILFSPAQYENQLWGHQVCMFLSIFMVTASIWLNITDLAYSIKFAGCAVLSLLATFSFANGLLCWIIAFPLFKIWFTQWPALTPQKKRLVLVSSLLYVVLAIIVFIFYFKNLTVSPPHPPLSFFLKNPLTSINFLLIWVGSPFPLATDFTATHVLTARMAGFGVLLGLAFALFGAIRQGVLRRKEVFNTYYPWLCLTAYGLASGLLTTKGRASYNLEFALASRYTSIAIWVTIGLIGFIYINRYQLQAQGKKASVLLTGLLGLLVLVTVYSWILGIKDMSRWQQRQQQNLFSLRLSRLSPNNPLLAQLHPSPPVIMDRINYFFDKKALPYEPVGDWVQQKISNPDDTAAGGFMVNKNQESNLLEIKGWLAPADSRLSPSGVIICYIPAAGKPAILTGLVTVK